MKLKKLEAIRGFVALYIVLHHFVLFNQLYPGFYLPAPVAGFFMFPGEAVLVFFMLSGFVIYLSVSRNAGLSFTHYLRRRFIRIYPITIAAFLLSTLVFAVNNWLGSKLFSYNFSSADLESLIGNLLMLQDNDFQPGIIVLPYLKNYPLWSLSYEWWYYMLFFPLFIFFSCRKVKYPVFYILFISLAGWGLFLLYPSHVLIVIAYFLLWWVGAECARVYVNTGNFKLKHLLPVLLNVAIMCVAIALPVAKGYFMEHKTYAQLNANYPITGYLHYYVACFVFLCVGWLWWHFKLRGFDAVLGPFKRLAPISFALYLVHFPILWLDLSFLQNPFLIAGVKLMLIFSIAYLLEIKMQPWVSAFLNKRTGNAS